MTALTGFCALGHLDLDLFGTDKIAGSYTETSGSHLFDSGAAVFTVSARFQTLRGLAALTAVGFAVQSIHGQSQSLMSLL